MNRADFSFIRYSNCWEDTGIMLKALGIQEGETGISVASAGDNTLAMLLKNPHRVYAFDVNPTQLYCCELKMACFRCLSYKEMLTLLGVRRGERTPLYARVRHALSKDAQRYFDENTDLIERGIIHTGKFENFFGIFRKFIIPLFSTNEKFRTFAAMECTEKQREFYSRHIDNRRLKAVFRIYFGYKVMGRLGRDKSFYNYVNDKEQSGNDIRRRFEFGISNTVNACNPYINYIVSGNYTPRSLPLYLRPESFDTIRKRIDRITLIHGDLLSLEGINADFANLSDIFEYMSESEFERNAHRLSEILNTGGRLAYFNMQNRRYLRCSGFEYDKQLSEALFRRNNSWFYRDFSVYRRSLADEQNRSFI